MPVSPVFIIVLLVLVGLTVNARDGWDRWIYGAFTLGTALALTRYREMLTLPDWSF